MARSGAISAKKAAAIAALLNARSIVQAAEKAGVSKRTLTRWLADPAFRAALLEAEGRAIDDAARRLVGLADSAVVVMAAVMADPANSPAVRLRAAQGVVDSLIELRTLRNVEERLTRLEVQLGITP